MLKVWQSKVWHSRVPRLVTLVALAVVMAMLVIAQAPSARAAGYCQCTTYVANYYGLNGNYPNANQWGSYLQNQGWYQDSGISGGDIAVFQGNVQITVTKTQGCCYFTLTMGSVGHVAIVTWLQWHNTVPGYYTVKMQGANQGLTPTFTDSNCTDVSNFYWNVGGSSSGQWIFYHHP